MRHMREPIHMPQLPGSTMGVGAECGRLDLSGIGTTRGPAVTLAWPSQAPSTTPSR